MITVLTILGYLLVYGLVLIGLSFLASSIMEHEKRATFFGGIQLAGMLLIAGLFTYLAWAGFFHTALGTVVLVIGLLSAVAGIFFLARRTEANASALQGTRGYIQGDVKRQDEREEVFARNRSIPPDDEIYHNFYEAHPEWQAMDEARRERGGPLGTLGAIDHPNEGPNVAALLASLSIPALLSAPEKVKPSQHPYLRDTRMQLSPQEATERVKGYARHLGAVMVGVTALDPNWVYSHRGEIFHGNWEDWGRPIEVSHPYAIVFAEEMSLDMVGTGPHVPTSIESMKNYADGAIISTQVAAYIANMGYSATANHLRHYEALMVPLAVDAGLGELGRFGYLITKKYGGRIRLSAVTTDLPLIPDQPVDLGVLDFCEICKKCATCCPSRSIPSDEQTVTNGTLRWKLNAETCFEFWGKVGTDCNVCMRVCPWSHADTFPHRLIKFFVTRNRHARRLFNAMDDLFYGKRPKAKPAPSWAANQGSTH